MFIDDAKREILRAVKLLVDRGLVQRTWGNVSVRVGENHMVITPSGLAYDLITEDNLPLVDIRNLKYEGDIKPSTECGIHAEVYKLQAETNVVIHTHQTYATCISVAGFSELRDGLPRFARNDSGDDGNDSGDDGNDSGGRESCHCEERSDAAIQVSIASYGTPGSAKLRKAVASKLAEGSNSILMERHGALFTAESLDSAFNRAEAVEDICKKAMRANLGSSPEETEPEIEQLLTGIRRAIKFIFPEYEDFGMVETTAVEELSAKIKRLPAMIDDFAMMIGPDIKSAIYSDNDAICTALGGRNAVMIEGLGILCVAENRSDLDAAIMLTEKNVLVYLNAASYGEPKPLGFLESRRLRSIYLNSYSKRKNITQSP
jgi:L-fuculose-phosphate aldolase